VDEVTAPAAVSAAGEQFELQQVHKGISTGRGGLPALVDVTLTVPRRHTVAVHSASSTSRYVLARVAAGSERPDRGHVVVDGAPPAAGQVAETPPICPVPAYTRVRDAMVRMLRRHLPSKSHAQVRVSRTLAALDLSRLARMRGGQLEEFDQAKLQVAWALSRNPAFLVVHDLDRFNRLEGEPAAFVAKVAAPAFGCGVLYVTRWPEHAANADRWLRLENGVLSGL
jgi:predicted ABC-type transport system involved in lysophospholipase L1 biosynthesis ATPase subunit